MQCRRHDRNPLGSKDRTSQPFLCASSGTAYRHASQAKCTHLSKQPPTPTPMHQMPQIWPKNLDGQINSRLYVVRESEPGWNTSDRSALYRPRGGKGALQEWKGSLQKPAARHIRKGSKASYSYVHVHSAIRIHPMGLTTYLIRNSLLGLSTVPQKP